MMVIKNMFIILVVMLLTSMLPFFKPFHEPVQVIFRYLFAM